MDKIWSRLGIEPTEDIAAIKQAYAEKAKVCHPEEDPEGFLQLRNAYQAAMNYAQQGAGGASSAEAEEEQENGGWTLSQDPKPWDEGPNPYADHEAIRRFLDLYTSKQRKDPKRWLDYITSDAFLDVAWERRFTALMLEHVMRLEGEYPVNREFLNWLCAAYQFTVDKQVYMNPDGSDRNEFYFQIQTDAQFEGQEFLFQIAMRGPAPKVLKGAERAVCSSFADYRRLNRLVEEGVWSEQVLSQAGHVLDHYVIGNFTEKNPGESQRHPAGMRLIERFFRQDGLPEELYQMAWQKLELKTALMGRAKLLYGGLRERVLEQVPSVAEAELDRRQLNKDFEQYRWSVKALEKTGRQEDWARAEEETRAFLARKDVQRGLWDRRFAEERMIYHVQWCGEHFAQQIMAFYEQHPDAPCAERLTQLVVKSRRQREIEQRNQEDRAAGTGSPTLAWRPFFRHWLNTGFYHAKDRDTGRGLGEYLTQELPYLPEWSRTFLQVEEGSSPVPVAVSCKFQGSTVEVRFHLRYMAFLLDGEPVYRACLPWEQVMALADTDTFFFLLPVTTAVYDQYEAVKTEILRRLEETAAPESNRDFLAGCLADQVCGLPLPDAPGLALVPEEEAEEQEEQEVYPLPPESVLPFEIFAEDADRLFVCTWLQREQQLFLFQQTEYGKHARWEMYYDGIADADTAVKLAHIMLEEQMNPKGLPMEELKVLPQAVYGQWDYNVISRETHQSLDWSRPVELLDEEITLEQLDDLLTQFSEGRMVRLEWSWTSSIPVGEEQGYEPQRSLLFLKDKGWYACLYFDDFRAECYALLEQPELYGKQGIEHVPFFQGELLRRDVHRSFVTIRQHLNEVFSQVSWPNNVGFMAGRIWDRAIHVSHGRAKYNLDKQLLGGFPMKRAHNRPDMNFYFSSHPSSAALVNREGAVERLEVTEQNRLSLQQLLARFMQGDGSKLRMTWGTQEGKRRHIVLLADQGRFQLVWIMEEKQTAEYHVADHWVYLDVEGKKYPKETFQNRLTPAYLIHDLISLRNALDLLLANMEHPETVTRKFAEYADEKPVKPRPYETLWAELVADTL